MPNAHQLGKHEGVAVWVLDFVGMISGYQLVSVFTHRR